MLNGKIGHSDAKNDSGSEVMSAVETKSPGTFTRGVREKFSDEKATKLMGIDTWRTDIVNNWIMDAVCRIYSIYKTIST